MLKYKRARDPGNSNTAPCSEARDDAVASPRSGRWDRSGRSCSTQRKADSASDTQFREGRRIWKGALKVGAFPWLGCRHVASRFAQPKEGTSWVASSERPWEVVSMSRERRWTRIAVVCIYEALCDVVDTGDVFNTYSNGRLTLPESSSTQEEDHLRTGVCGRGGTYATLSVYSAVRS